LVDSFAGMNPDECGGEKNDLPPKGLACHSDPCTGSAICEDINPDTTASTKDESDRMMAPKSAASAEPALRRPANSQKVDSSGQESSSSSECLPEGKLDDRSNASHDSNRGNLGTATNESSTLDGVKLSISSASCGSDQKPRKESEICKLSSHSSSIIVQRPTIIDESDEDDLATADDPDACSSSSRSTGGSCAHTDQPLVEPCSVEATQESQEWSIEDDALRQPPGQLLKKTKSTRFLDSDRTNTTGATTSVSDHGESCSNQSEEERRALRKKQPICKEYEQEELSSVLNKRIHNSVRPLSTSSLDDDDSSGDNDDDSDSSIVFQSSNGSIEFDSDSISTMVHHDKPAEKRRGLSIIISRSSRSSLHRYMNSFRIIAGKIANHPRVQTFIVVLIIINALQMGIATFDFVYYNPSIRAAFDKVDMAFLVIFTIEIILQGIFHGFSLFKDKWLTFDFLIVVFSWMFASLQVFRTLRTLRLVAKIEMLRKLIEALVEAVPRLAGIMALFILIMYIYAVMITVLFGNMYEEGLLEKDYFSRLDITLFTLFQMITLDWANIVRQVMAVYPFAAIVFGTYLSFTSFILFSLVIGVVCDAVSAIEHDNQMVEALEKKEDAQERILRLQQRVDFLQKQQKSVLASVSGVLEELRKEEGLAPGSAPGGILAMESLASSSSEAEGIDSSSSTENSANQLRPIQSQSQ